MKKYNILVINPGSTSTKVSVFSNEILILDQTIRHSSEDLAKFNKISDQKDFRFDEIKKILNKVSYKIEDIDAIAARGGLIKPIESGTYEINEAMILDLQTDFAALHASSLAGLIAYDLKNQYNIPAFVVDPVVVDELSDVARLSGIPFQNRVSVFHALNQKAIANECALSIGKKYDKCNFIIAHMGGGITVAAHSNGRAIDVNNGVDGEGPFSPERCGSIPVMRIVEMCFSGEYSVKDIKDLCTKTGGMNAYLGTNDLRDCEAMISNGDDNAKLVYDAMSYQIAKEIGSMAVVLDGKIDAIILTGGLAYSETFVGQIKEKINFLAPIKVYPGEDESKALASSVLDVLQNNKEVKIYI